MVLEVVAIRRLYGRSHLDHVLGTFGLLLFFNELVRLVWGPAGMTLSLPQRDARPRCRSCPGIYYPVYRLVIICVTLAVAALLYVAGDAHPARHADPRRRLQSRNGRRRSASTSSCFTRWYSGSAPRSRALPGVMQAPILTVQIGMGENILILAFVVVIIGGIGSIRGAFVAALMVGLDRYGRPRLPARYAASAS